MAAEAAKTKFQEINGKMVCKSVHVCNFLVCFVSN